MSIACLRLEVVRYLYAAAMVKDAIITERDVCIGGTTKYNKSNYGPRGVELRRARVKREMSQLFVCMRIANWSLHYMCSIPLCGVWD